MNNQFDRTKIIIGDDNLNKLKTKKVIVFGLGGVGGYVCESLVRTGIYNIDIVDKDVIDITNLNRQIISKLDNIGKKKVDAMKQRLLSINNNLNIDTFDLFYIDNKDKIIDFSKYDYVIDCIDNITAKISIIIEYKKLNINIISSMGTGFKTDPMRFMVSDIYDTKVCPIAKILRHKLKEQNIDRLKVVYSDEMPIKNDIGDKTIGSLCSVVGVCGFIIAQEVIKDLLLNN